MSNPNTASGPSEENFDDRIVRMIFNVLDGDYIHSITNRKELYECAKKSWEEEKRRYGFLDAAPKGKGEDATEIIKGLKDILNYFGTTEEHRMYAVAQKILKVFELSD